MTTSPTVALCFGEILWDFLPTGLFLGGAPANVAYHMERLGQPARVVSAVGQDVLGDEILRRLTAEGFAVNSVVRHPLLPTGYVRAALGCKGDASYEIARGVAWDEITIAEATCEAAVRAGALIYGSLAQRTEFNRATLASLVGTLPASALRVFDVNLRPPHDDLVLVRELARHASLLKLNAEEAARLAGTEPRPGLEEAHARQIADLSGCGQIWITAAERGAGLLNRDCWYWEKGRPVEVVDTVGAGDAFLARIVAGILRGEEPGSNLLARACRLGEWVAGRRGATPVYDSGAPL